MKFNDSLHERFPRAKSLLARAGFLILICAVFCWTTRAQDEVELLSGLRIQGKIVERTEKLVRIQITVNNQTLLRSYPLDRLRSITQEGKRQLLGEAEGAGKPGAPPAAAAITSSEVVQRSQAEIDALLDQLGRTPPSWFEETALEFPATLDLTWPDPSPVIWNYTRNVDHYIWDIINSNPKRYQSGVRLMHHLLIVNEQKEDTRARVMNELGRMYFEFFNDYARAAFWWRQAKVDQNPKFTETSSPARLAECYWKLGNRAMAVQLMEKLPLTLAIIKAWGDLKETDKALGLCEEGLQRGFLPSETYLIAGDVSRTARRFEQAAEFYRKVLEVEAKGSPAQMEQIKRDQERARATIEVIRLFDALDLNQIPEGSYSGKSQSYGGILEVETVVKASRLEEIKVIYNPDRQYFYAVEDTIRRILNRQTVNGVDAISGATFTSEAVIRASAKALAEGMGTGGARK